MVANAKNSIDPDLKLLIDTLMISFGIITGGVITLVGLWLWLDYQENFSQSILVLFSSKFVEAMPPSIQEVIREQTQLMGLPLIEDTKAFWYIARAGGIIAYLLMWLMLVWGLTLSTKVTTGWISTIIAYGLHEFLSILAIIFTIIHIVVLMADKYIKFSIFDLLIPFISSYKPGWTGLGVISFYLLIGITVSSFIRKKIGATTWRALHYFGFVAYAAAIGHSLMAGSDTSLLSVKLMYFITTFTILFLILYRFLTLKVKTK